MHSGASVFKGALLSALLASPAARAEGTESYVLAWTRGEGAASCLSEVELASRVRSRLGRDPFAPVGSRTIEGHVVRTAAGFEADLGVRSATDEVIGQRRVSTQGADCSSLGGAVTLAIVLTIDPDAHVDPGQASASFPIDEPPSPPALPLPPPPACTENVARWSASPCPPPPPQQAQPGTLIAAAGALGPLPQVAPGVVLDVTLPTWPLAVVFGARFLFPMQTDDGHLQVGLDTLGLSGCWRMVSSSSSIFGLCLGGEGGVTTVVARDLTPVSPGPYPWFALTAGLRFTLRSSSLVRFQGGASALLPLIRQEFQVDSAGVPGFQSSVVGALLFAGAELGGI
jgi:hypothetical protein